VTRKIEELEAQLVAAVSEQDKIDALCILALELCEDNPERAYELGRQAYQLSQSGDFHNAPYIKGMVDSMAVTAWYYYEQVTDYAVALETISEALSLAKSDHYAAGEIRAFYQLGLIHHRIGNYPQALDNYLEALNLARQTDHKSLEGQTLRAMARLYSGMDDPNQMLVYNQAALAIFAEINDEFYYPLLLNNTSMALMHVGRYEEALAAGFRAKEQFEAVGSWRGLSAVEDTIGQVYAAMGNFDEAIVFMRQSMERMSGTDEKARLSLGLLNLGKLYLQQERPDEALPLLLEALAVTEEIDSKPRLYECHQELSLVYEQKGDLEQALFHHKAYLRVYREVVNEQSLQKLKLFEVIHRTEQAQADVETQRQLREQERDYYERLSQMREQLISTTSHDLKNPLSAILNYVHLLDKHQKTNDDTGQRYLKRIEAQVEQMRYLISDLLDLARLDTGRALKCEDVGVQQFVGQIIADFGSQAYQKNIQLSSMIQPDNLSINIDPRQMGRVLNNLVSNAIKYTQQGGRASVLVRQDGDNVVIIVEDTGMGIPEDDLPQIFERFYRVDSEAHANIDGMGLGLAIVKSIVEQHGGRVHVDSVVGRGSRFQLTIPAVAAAGVS
jgi:signal transduction histidine kinase